MKKNKGFFVIVLLVLSLVFYFGYQYVFRPQKTTAKTASNFKGDLKEFYQKIESNPDVWVNQIIEISGVISAIEKDGIIMNNNTYCQFNEKVNTSSLKINEKVIIKGKFIGYDDLLDELKLNQCILK